MQIMNLVNIVKSQIGQYGAQATKFCYSVNHQLRCWQQNCKFCCNRSIILIIDYFINRLIIAALIVMWKQAQKELSMRTLDAGSVTWF